MPIPTLETPRLILRGHTLEDFDETLGMWSDPVVVRHIGGRAFTGEEVWSRLLRYAGHWALLGFGYWVVRERESGRFVGEVGFADFRREIEPTLAGSPEIGWILASHAHGQGYATEAARAVLDWGHDHFGPIPTVCLIAPKNMPSLRVAEKFGYVEIARTSYKGESVVILRR